jgi:transaldolase/glucose-6-phosphate isomerase
MKSNPLLKLGTFGQSIWLDFLRRRFITSGELQRMIQEDGLRGITSNLAILDRTIAGSHDYDDAIRALALAGKSARQIYETLTVEDVQHAADAFRPIYDESDGQDGFVSLEVSPHLARDTASTIEQARHLWVALDRPNVMIKIPATAQGLPALQQLVAEGINVNVTLLFGLLRYREVVNAYIAGLEVRAKQGKPLNRVASVASFFLSRIDVLADSTLEDLMKQDGPKSKVAESLHGQVAIANAKVAYQIFGELFGSERFRALAAQGARPQQPLWASMGITNPTYGDIKYIEALIGPGTVNAVPLETLNAYRDHGDPAPRLEEDGEHALRELRKLAEVNIDLEQITQQLENEGVRESIKSFDNLMETLEKARAAALEAPTDPEMLDLGQYGTGVQKQLDALEQGRFTARLWRKDPSLWEHDHQGQTTIKNALGWLHVAERMEENVQELAGFLAEVRDAGFRHVVHMGMGGSSLAPLIFQRNFTPSGDGLPLTVLDTTDPATILRIERSLPLAETLFIVASKSGTTAESLAFGDYFYAKLKALKGDSAGENMVSITDPGTPLEALSHERGFRQVFLNFADIGGRWSALSYFGLVPAALVGMDVRELVLRALRMEHACACCLPTTENPGILLGAAMGELALSGRDKVTFLIPETVTTLGMWLEQLLAESTGKDGSGLVPVAGEPLGEPAVYGDDRFFVHIRLKDKTDDKQERSAEALREAGHPVVTIQLGDLLDLGQEFFRWEIATATAGAILGINAFDQPNVQESKDNTNRLLAVAQEKGQLPEEEPALVEEALSVYVQDAAPTVAETVARFLDQARPGDYVALLAYLTEEPQVEQALQTIREHLRDHLCLATTLGYGPRYLHSTGQLHKGGPNTGLFLQLTAEDTEDIDIPGRPYTFGVMKQAQARGDLEALRKHGRRVMRVHLGTNTLDGLRHLAEALP